MTRQGVNKSRANGASSGNDFHELYVYPLRACAPSTNRRRLSVRRRNAAAQTSTGHRSRRRPTGETPEFRWRLQRIACLRPRCPVYGLALFLANLAPTVQGPLPASLPGDRGKSRCEAMDVALSLRMAYSGVPGPPFAGTRSAVSMYRHRETRQPRHVDGPGTRAGHVR